MSADGYAAGRARSDLDTWLRQQFVLSPVSRNDIVMAVYEALANAAEHAYQGNAIEVETFDLDAAYDFWSDTLTVVVEDHGQWQTRDPADPPRIARGRGIQLMYSLAESASITTNATGTRVCLMWTGVQLRD
jgi:anti-sigma regulatory factor (Ser/Thr protein kinase)